MKISRHLLKDQRGMTGLETAIILIAFVTVAAVFSYAVLSAGLFSAERGKETIYAGLQEAKSNLEICGSVMATSTDSTNVAKVIFTLKNAIAGTPIDMTACNGTGNAANKCVISLTTSSDYLNNVKWTKTAVGNNDGDNLLEPGEMFEISVNMSDLGDNMTLSENLTANKTFGLQVKPALGASVTVQRTLPAAISSVMDLDLGIGGGSSVSGGGGGTGQPVETASLAFYGPTLMLRPFAGYGSVWEIVFSVENTGTTNIDMTWDSGCPIDVVIEGGNTYNMYYYCDNNPMPPSEHGLIDMVFNAGELLPGDTFTLNITPQGGSTLLITFTVPDPMTESYIYLTPQ
jgi:archaeal flagellin FlaB